MGLDKSHQRRAWVKKQRQAIQIREASSALEFLTVLCMRALEVKSELNSLQKKKNTEQNHLPEIVCYKKTLRKQVVEIKSKRDIL